MMKEKTISFRLAEQDREAIQKMAKLHMIRIILEDYIKENIKKR